MWYSKLVITDLNSVEHEIIPSNLGPGKVFNINLAHKQADDFEFTIEDYDGSIRTWLEKGCIIEVFIGTSKPPTNRRMYGMIEDIEEEQPLTTTVILTCTGRDKFSIYGERKVTETYLNMEISDIVKDLLEKYAPDMIFEFLETEEIRLPGRIAGADYGLTSPVTEKTTTTTIDATPTTLDDVRFPYRSLRECIDYLAYMGPGYTYRIEWPIFYWKVAKTEDTGIDYGYDDITEGPKKKSSIYPIKNRVFVLGGDHMEVDQQQTTIAGTPKNTKDYWYAQSFTPGRSDLDQLSLYLKRTGDPANLEGEIRSDSGGSGPQDKLADFIIDKDFIGTSASWRPVQATASLLIDVKYWIVLKKVGDVSNYYEWYHDDDTAGENAYSSDGSSWTVQSSSYQMAYKTHFAVPIIAVKQDYDLRDKFEWREIVHEDKAILSRILARDTAQALLDELKDETPTIKNLNTVNQTEIPDRGKMVSVNLSGLKIDDINYEVKQVDFTFKGGEDGTNYMNVHLGRSEEELAEWLNRRRLDIDRTKIGAYGVGVGLVNIYEGLGPDAVVAGDNLVVTEKATGTFVIGTAKIGFSDVG